MPDSSRLLALVLLAMVLGSCVAGEPTKGRIPAEALGPDGTLDPDQVPDFVIAYAQDGSQAGYVSKDDLLIGDVPKSIESNSIPVFDESLVRLVGHMVPNLGFVPGNAE